MTKNVAETIYDQLGGNRFVVMTGVRNLLHDDNSLSFHLGRSKNRANRVKITLTSDDLYTVRFSRFTMPKLQFSDTAMENWAGGISGDNEIETITGVFADDLVRIFEDRTGIITKL
jgi:hypothetical protein